VSHCVSVEVVVTTAPDERRLIAEFSEQGKHTPVGFRKTFFRSLKDVPIQDEVLRFRKCGKEGL
jgi:hypothetical protein